MKGYLRSALALLMALLMVLSLAACAKTESPAEPQEESPAYAYAADYQRIESDSRSLTARCFTDEGFYAVSMEKVGEAIPEGVEPEYEGQYDVYEARIFFANDEGKLSLLKDYQPLPARENTDNYLEFHSGSNISGLAVDSEGALVVVEDTYYNAFTGTEEQKEDENSWELWEYENKSYIRVLDKNGKELSCEPVDNSAYQDSYINFNTMALDRDGNVLGCSEDSILAFDRDGALSYSIKLPDYVNNLVLLKDGSVGAVLSGENGAQVCVLDLEGRKAGESHPLDAYVWEVVRGGGDYDFFYTNGQDFYGCSLESGESQKVLSWLDVDVNSNFLSGVTVREDGSILCVINDWSAGEETETHLVTLRQVPAESLPEKEILTMAVMNLNYDYTLTNAIIKFNRSNDKARIQVLDYAQYNTEDDDSAGLTKLNTEIMAGNMPDLLRLSELPYRQLAAKGLLEDLYPYLDADKELKREDFFPTVLRAMEVDGKLFEICNSFSIHSLIGASSVVGDTPGWTYQDFERALSKMPEGCTPLDQYTTRDDILRTLVFLEMDRLVDWSSGKVSFDDGAFVDILNFAARFPERFDWDNFEWSEQDEPEIRIREGRQMLMPASIFEVNNLMYNEVYFGGETTYIGYPTSGGVGSMLSLGSGDGGVYAISSACRNKELAWQFLRGFLTKEAQESIWGLPVNRKVFDAQLEKAMTPQYKKDAQGRFVLDAEGNKIQISQGQYGTSDGKIHNIYAMSQEQADKLMEVIETCTRAVDYNDSIFSIVQEQAQAFFAGQKSAEEVARLVQSKANIYVNEQR